MGKGGKIAGIISFRWHFDWKKNENSTRSRDFSGGGSGSCMIIVLKAGFNKIRQFARQATRTNSVVQEYPRQPESTKKKNALKWWGAGNFPARFPWHHSFCQQTCSILYKIHPSNHPSYQMSCVLISGFTASTETVRLVETHRSFPGDDTPILRNWWGSQIRQPAGMVETCLFGIELGYNVSSWGCLTL